jgi:alkaline phosphatase D
MKTTPQRQIGTRILVVFLIFCAMPNAVAFATQTIDPIFRHGVASGDPDSDAVIIWTRVSPANLEPVVVNWSVASDPEMSDVLQHGRVTTRGDTDYTVKVDVRGLEPSTTYFYRFAAAGAESPVGRAKTLPVGSVEMTRLAVVSCANYPSGYFTAYRMLAQRDDVDVVLHLGDYIYEYENGRYGNLSGRELEPAHEILTLADYRARYAHYRQDPDLQVVHQRHSFIGVWDDHEIADNAWQGGAYNHNNGVDEGPWAARRAAAMQAYYEWLPVRPPVPGVHERIYRSFEFGNLAQLIVLDTRHVGRDEQLIYNDFERDDPNSPFDVDAFMASYRSMDRSILGHAQLDWLKSQVRQSIARGQKWRILGQQVIFADLLLPDVSDIESIPNRKINEHLARHTERTGQGFPLNLDAWSGYPGSRTRVGDFLKSLDEKPVFLTGDTHSSWGIELRDERDRDSIGVEFGAPGISSPSMAIDFPDSYRELERRIKVRNPDIKYADLRHRGYLLVIVTADSVTGEWHYVDVDDPASTETCSYAARVLAGHRGSLIPVACGD